MEFDKFIENLELIYSKADYLITQNNPFLSSLPKLYYLESHMDYSLELNY